MVLAPAEHLRHLDWAHRTKEHGVHSHKVRQLSLCLLHERVFCGLVSQLA